MEPCGWALLLAGLDRTGEAVVLRRALGSVGVPEALEEAEAAGLVVVAHGRVAVFADPVAASPADRRRAHAALAAALEDPVHAEQRALHLADAADGPDEVAADALADAAGLARAAGDLSATATRLERAARLTPDVTRRAHRLHIAGEAHWLQGRTAEAERLLQEAVALPVDPGTRADAMALLAQVVLWERDPLHRRRPARRRRRGGDHRPPRARRALLRPRRRHGPDHL